ncbi:MAG: hypothetical protein JWN32_1999, partial [Solirubrobacterales bacterium]|nr:hypothetical protein [Solirubrobacterales bacterium]
MNSSPLSAYAALEHMRELQAAAAAKPTRRAERPALPAFHRVSIRYAGPSDAAALSALAALDSRTSAPHGDVVLAELDGTPVAALGVDDGTAIADPFLPTADLVQML